MTPDLKQMPSYAGLHYIMSQKHFTPRTSLELEEKYNQVDINHLLEDEFDINNSILVDEPMEIAQEQEYLDERMAEEFETLSKIERDFENDL